MKTRYGLACALSLASSCAMAEWQLFESTNSFTTRYEIEGFRKMEGDLNLVGYKRMSEQHKPKGLVIADQFVAGCREGSRHLVVLMKANSSVLQQDGENLRVLDNKKFDPPQHVSTDDKAATTLATTVCKAS